VLNNYFDEEVGSHGSVFRLSSYTKDVPCAICKTAKARRFCPGVHEEICTACCGAGREETVDCPVSCEYLIEAHRHEKRPPADPEKMPGQDVPIDDEFLHNNEFLIVLLGSAIFEPVKEDVKAIDADAVDALDALTKTWRTLNAGIYYETKPVNPVALEIYDAVKNRVDDLRKRIKEADSTALPDNVVLGVLTFFQRVAFGLNNGRARCKTFLEFLSQSYMDMADEEETAGAVEEPRVIL
jgi:hypothetical protein